MSPGSNRNSNTSVAAEDVPLATLNRGQRVPKPKKHDFVPLQPFETQELPEVDRTRLVDATTPDHYDSDTTATDSDGTADDDDFDWDAEDDAASQQQTRGAANVKRGRRVWHAFMALSRPLRTLIIAFIGTGILITPLIVFQTRFANTPGHTQAHVWSLWLAVTWAAGCATYLLVDLAPQVVLWISKLLSHRVERMQITVDLTKAVLPWLKLALDVSSSWIALSIIRAVYQPTGNYWVTINRVMQAFFSAAILVLTEKIFLQYVAINFHQRALADRIVENQLGLRALDRLSNATPYANTRRRAAKRGHRSGVGSRPVSMTLDSVATPSITNSPLAGSSPTEKGEGLHLEKISREAKVRKKDDKRRKRRRVAAVIVEGVGDAFNQMAFKNSKYHREGGTIFSASKLARKLFSTLQGQDRLLTVEDFYPYFNSEADAQAAFDVFDKDGNGDISKREMRDAVRRIYRERKALTASLKDLGSAVAKLDAVLLFVVLMIFIFICLLVFNRDNTISSLVPLATIILGFSFIFGHSAQTLFESLIFIFSTHVFDVGDLVMIDDSPMFVVEFGLFSTTFKRVDGQTVIAPNALLASAKTVHNLRRSSSMWETTNLMVSFDTPLESLESLRKKLEEYVSSEQNRREWSSISLHIEKMEFQNAIHLIVGMEHRPNWQDWGGRWARRTKFMRHLKTCLEELGVGYTMPMQPVLLPASPGGPFGPGGGGASLGRGPGSIRSPRSPTPLSPNVLRHPSVSSRETLAMRAGDGGRDMLSGGGGGGGAHLGTMGSRVSLR